MRIVKIVIVLTAFVIFCLAIALPDPANAAKREFLEKHYQAKHCPIKKQREHRLPNGMRVDCMTKIHAIEYDWANKYRQSFTQALEYSMYSNRKAGIVLILEKNTDVKYVDRLRRVIRSQCIDIDVWTVGPGMNTKKTLVIQ